MKQKSIEKDYLRKTCFFMGLVFLITFCSCEKKCEGIDSKTEWLLAPDIKNAILGFPQGSRWVFECVTTGERDTFFFSIQEIYPLEKGDCALQDKGKCCSDNYFEKSNQRLEVHSSSGLNNFNSYFTDAYGLWLRGNWGTILLENDIYSKGFLSTFNQTIPLVISNKVITDVNAGSQYRNNSTPESIYWSKQYGLVKYSYKTSTGTVIKEYERIDLP